MTARTMWVLMIAVMTVGVLATSTPARADGFNFSIILGDRDVRHAGDNVALQLGWVDDRDDTHRYRDGFEPCDKCRDRDQDRWCDRCNDRYDRYHRDRDRGWYRDRDRDRDGGRRVTLPPGVYGGPYGLYAETDRGTVPVVVEPDRRGYTTTIYGERRSPFVGRPNWAHEQWQTNDRAPVAPVTVPAPIANDGRGAHPIGPPITR